jgi:hypothetical protein
MIPVRYLGPIHCVGLTLREEGIRGLYRGYTAYILAMSIYMCVVPIATEICMQKTPLSGNVKDSSDDLY